MFTLWPAYAAFEERDKGSIEVGKLADFTVLSKDIMKIPEPEILTTTCAMTVIGGEIVFERTRQASESDSKACRAASADAREIAFHGSVHPATYEYKYSS